MVISDNYKMRLISVASFPLVQKKENRMPANLNRLTQAQFARVYEWIKNNSEELANKPQVLVRLSDRAEKELGFRVSPGSIRRAARAAGVKIFLKVNSSE